jgi:hypothetical protein
MYKNKRFYIFLVFIGLFTVCCTEEVDLGLENNAGVLDILVVEATITNEFKNHRVNLSRMDTILDTQIDSTFNPFTPERDIDRDLVKYERNARVSVENSTGTTYIFNEISPGIYESAETFAAMEGQSYTLNILTSDGKTYTSEPMAIEGFLDVDQLYAERMTNDHGEEGIGIFIDNGQGSGSVNNLRFSYDETYKIVAPFWDESDFKLSNYDPCALPVPTYDLEIVPRETEQQVCYGNQVSNSIILAENNTVDGTGFNRYMIRFLDQDDFMISHRYSIEVTQMVTGSESFGFYEKLRNFSQSENIFSQVQPGFIEGNISPANGEGDRVIGFFDVVSVSKERIFFDYMDFFPNRDLPPYVFNCLEQSTNESHVSYCFTGMQGPNPCPQSIIEQVNLGLISYAGPNTEDIGPCPSEYVYVPRICGDCTVLGSNVKPDFWID